MAERFIYRSESVPLILHETVQDYRDENAIDTNTHVGQVFEFDGGKFQALTSQSFSNSDEINWANAKFWDRGTGIDLMYDFNFLRKAFDDEEEDPGPYIASISIFRKDKNGHNSVDFGQYYYDRTGELRAIRFEPSFEVLNEPLIKLRKAEGLWNLYRFEDVNEEFFTFAEALMRGEIYTPDKHLFSKLDSGDKAIVDEVTYGLKDNGNRFGFTASVAAGRKTRVVEIPSSVDVEDWKSVMSGKNWTEVLKLYPVNVTIINQD